MCDPLFGSMSALQTQGLSSLTRRHAIKVASTVSVEKCCLAVGEVVGHASVLSASRMNNATVIFLDSVDKANELVERGIVIDGEFISVLPLSLPAKKVILSNVPPFVSDVFLTQALTRYGKLVSPIKKIPISSESPFLKHVVSFRRFVYMIIPEDADLDLTLNFRIDDFSYAIYVTTGKVKCFGCGITGHLIRNCPNKNTEGEKVEENATVEQGSEVEDGKGPETEAQVAGLVLEENVVDRTLEIEAEPVSSQIEQVDLNLNVLPTINDSSVLDAVASSSEGKEEGPNDEENHFIEVSEDAQLISEQDQIFFKTPQKRKMKNRVLDAKISKTADLQNEDMQETESDSDSSECSMVFSQGETSVRTYGLEEIKLFLRTTKNKRGVRVKDYFPDLKQFVDRTKVWMASDSFTNKEVYRLKKIVRSINNSLDNDEV